MDEKLPKGWLRTTLRELCLPISTIHPQDLPNVLFSYFDIGGIDNVRNRISETKAITGREAPSRAKQAVQRGDILFSNVRTYLRNIARIEDDYPNSVASTGFTVIRPADGVSPEYLFYFVLSDKFLRPLHALQTGTSYPAVRSRDVLDQEVLLPPFAEQKQIASKLRVLLSGVEKGEAAARRALARLEVYRTSVLRAAVVGELTGEWRERKAKRFAGNNGDAVLREILEDRRMRWEEAELRRLNNSRRLSHPDDWKGKYPEPVNPDLSDVPLLPNSWAWASLEMVAEIGSGIALSQNRSVRDAVEVPYLRVANVLRGAFDLEHIKTLRLERHRIADFLLRPGDILFAEGGDRDKLGRGAVWQGQIADCVHQNHIFRARIALPALLDAQFVSHWGNTLGQQFFLRHATQTTNLASISRSELRRLPIPVPPVDEQATILREVTERLGGADRLRTKVERQLELARLSRKSFLHDAFSGQLVVPTTHPLESAAALLERIQRARIAVAQQEIPMQRSARTKRGGPARRSVLDVLEANKGPMTAEELFRATGHSQDTVDGFFAELRELTEPPARIKVERDASGRTNLTIVS